jgi:hypothetical protein
MFSTDIAVLCTDYWVQPVRYLTQLGLVSLIRLQIIRCLALRINSKKKISRPVIQKNGFFKKARHLEEKDEAKALHLTFGLTSKIDHFIGLNS